MSTQELSMSMPKALAFSTLVALVILFVLAAGWPHLLLQAWFS
jgi:hypothetical protein